MVVYVQEHVKVVRCIWRDGVINLREIIIQTNVISLCLSLSVKTK